VILRTRALLAAILAGGLVASVADADAIRKCRSRSGEVLFTSYACPASFALVQKHEVAPPPAPDAPDAVADAIDRDALPPQAKDAPGQEIPGVMASAMLAARFARALSALSTLKTYSMMHQVETGNWPGSPEDLGLDRGTFHTEDIEHIDFEPTGAIVATLRPSFGEARRIWLRPSPSLGGATMRWDCETNLVLSPLLPGLGTSCSHRD
jgi:hypothetical protein